MIEIKTDAYQLGKSYFSEGFVELDKVARGESVAKLALLTGLVLGSTVILSGGYGGGKTSLTRNMWRVIDGATEDDVANIPVDSNLQEMQLVGGEISSTLTKTSEDAKTGILGVFTERTKKEITPMVTSDKLVINIDEFPRSRPTALNAILDAPEYGFIQTSAGKVMLDRLQLTTATINESGGDAAFDSNKAFVSRAPIGAIVGNTDIGHKLQSFDGVKLDPTLVNPFVTIPQLEILRSTIRAMKTSPKKGEGYIAQINLAASLINSEFQLPELERKYFQVGQSAKALALGDGVGDIDNDHVNMALRLWMAARIGSLAPMDEANEMLDDMHSKVTE